jgi:hypothetical protein
LKTNFKVIEQRASGACTLDTTPPTNTGITSVTANDNGSLSVVSSVATDATAPIRYEYYISTTNVGLFNTSNICLIKNSPNADIFTDANEDLLTSQLYYVGVRAVDGAGNRETNTLDDSATSLGVPDNSILLAIAALNTKIGTPTLSTVSADINSRSSQTSVDDIKTLANLIPALV